MGYDTDLWRITKDEMVRFDKLLDNLADGIKISSKLYNRTRNAINADKKTLNDRELEITMARLECAAEDYNEWMTKYNDIILNARKILKREQ